MTHARTDPMPRGSADDERVHRPHALVLASRFDMACDFVVSALRERGVAFARLNSEDLPSYRLDLDPVERVLRARSDALSFDVDACSLQAVYFRQPVFLRESAVAGRPAREQVARAHWSAFMRSLLVFSDARWVNPPAATYAAEHKAVQLAVAASLGFDVPRTAFTNAADALARVRGGAGGSAVGADAARADTPGADARVAIKGIDTVLAREADRETFGYTTLLTEAELLRYDLATMPFALQQALEGKLDVRVTVVGDACWAAAITEPGGRHINGDWRLLKGDVAYAEHPLSPLVAARCAALVRALGLVFGAVDLAFAGGRYFFLEVNPTGEWAWLEDALGFPISAAIAAALDSGNASNAARAAGRAAEPSSRPPALRRAPA